MLGGDYASGPVVRLHRQRVWIWITEWIEQDEGNTSGMQFVPLRRQVALRQGLVDGFSDTDSVITVFRGIPYAKPSRWRITICLVS